MVTSPFWRPAIVVVSLDARLEFARASFFFLQESLGQLYVWSKEQLKESNVFSAVIGVFGDLTSASVQMHRKWASRSGFVKDVASWLRRCVGLRADKVPGPSVPSRARSAPLRRMSI